MRRVLFIVNDRRSIGPTQSSALFIERLCREGVEVWVVGADGVSTEPSGSVVAEAVRVDGMPGWRARAGQDAIRWMALDYVDVVWVRTNPGRATSPELHSLLIQQLQIFSSQGGLVVNDPGGLMRASSKHYLHQLPEWVRPKTLVTASMARIRDFVAEHQTAVLKPMAGTQGRDVFLVRGVDDPNLSAIAAHLSQRGPAMVQTFANGAEHGDVRILLLNGEAIEVGGDACMVRRRPAHGEFRSNVHLGGRAERAQLTPHLRRVIEAVGPVLRRDGMLLVGLDVVGDLVVECNVFSPGGFVDAQTFTGRDFVAPVLEGLSRVVRGLVHPL